MQHAELLMEMAGIRIDGRRPQDIRRLCHNFISMNSDGGLYLEQGLNKVLVQIHGPQEARKKSSIEQSNDKCNAVCRLLQAPFSGTEWKKRRIGDKRIVEMENTLNQIVNEIIILDNYPRSDIVIVITVLETDGSLLCCIVNAISLALMEAGICMVEMMVACSVGFVRGPELCLDLNRMESSSGGAFMPVVMKSRSEEVLFLQLDSRLSVKDLRSALEVATIGCKKVKKYLEEAIRERNAATLTNSNNQMMI
mmetsp:Transcript_7200/g.10714  ORF Transcript_7200/g.10714 Transcript_7200/m.10714 type:complete len:252 (-) Transcript_7200:759-1514(-)